MPREVTVSVWPWFYHKRMLPKWAGLVFMASLLVYWTSPGLWWQIPLGFAIFFPVEYTVHRFVYHFFANRSLGKVVSKQHVAHHDPPQDLDFLFNDPRFGTVTAAAFFGIYFLISRDLGVAAAITTGNYVGFVYYEWIHLAAHRPGVTPWMPWNRALKRSHLWHHFKNEAYWFGVTSSAFDHALGTHPRPSEVELSPTVRTLVAPLAHHRWMEEVREKKGKKGAPRDGTSTSSGTD